VRSILLALGASGSWGVADFFAGVKSRTLGVLPVLLFGQSAGLVAISIFVAARGQGPPGPAVLLALPAAAVGTVGLVAFLRAMSVGSVSIVAPIVGLSVTIPVAYGVVRGDDLTALQAAGIGLGLAGVVLAAREPASEAAHGRRVASGVGLALVAAVGFGCFFPFMDAAAADDWAWPALVFRTLSVPLVVAAILATRTRPSVPRAQIVPLALIGLGDIAGIAMFGAASQGGLVSLVSVLASLYPVVTVILAATVLHERLSRTQLVGVVAALGAVVLISAG
jgi:drug/metabolite transporter (DMT)-like permease